MAPPIEKNRTVFGNISEYIPGDNFGEYVERLEQFFSLNEITEAQKVSFLILYIGAETYSTLKKLCSPDEPGKKTYAELIKKLTDHFTPSKNIIAERYKFHKEDQKPGQSVAEYEVQLRARAQTCKFGNFLLEALRDRFVFGILNDDLRVSLLKETDITLEKAISMATSWELATKENKRSSAINQFSVRSVSHRSRSKSRTKQKPFSKDHSKLKNTRSCGRCGGHHMSFNQCPAQQVRCNLCGFVGHYARVCLSKRGNWSNKQSGNGVQQMSRELHKNKNINGVFSQHYEGAVYGVREENTPVAVDLWVENIKVKFECDSGACKTVIIKDLFERFFPNLRIVKTTKCLLSVTGENINLVGKATVRVGSSSNRSKEYLLDLFVIETKNPIPPLIGRDWLDVLFPDWRKVFGINRVSDHTTDFEVVNLINSKYHNIISNAPGQTIRDFKADILLDYDVPPIFHKAYPVPFKFREVVSKELDRLCEQGILVPVKHSEWASPVVIVHKPDKNIRLCIDCKVTINPYLRTETYPLPRIDDVFASLGNCKYFCALDLTGAYNQLVVSEKTQKYLTINTFRGLYRYTTLCFGVASAPSIFQSVMDRILQGISNVFCYLDDILIGGDSLESCKNNLELVLQRLHDYNVKINLNKCKFFQTTLDFLGHTITEFGIKPSKEKVKAITDAPSPKTLQQLQSYLGLLNYYSRFIPNLSSEIHELYKLLRKTTKFEWTDACQQAFEKSKSLLEQHSLLEIYDPTKEMVVVADASPYGIGAILLKVENGIEKPVLYASSTLSPSEKNYSQIHREGLAIIFAVQQFHKYIYGHKFKLCSDAQALREIFNPKKGTSTVACSRLQRWAVILSMYDYEFIYRPSKSMSHVDALSRLPLERETNIEGDLLCTVNQISSQDKIDIEKVREELNKDLILNKIYTYVLKGWPNKRDLGWSNDLKYYYQLRNNLSIEDGCLYFKNSLIIPSTCKQSILKKLHSSHEGCVRMKMAARGLFWWRHMSQDIENLVKKCHVCTVTQNVPREVVTSKWRPTTYPFERAHLDLFFFRGDTYSLVMDSNSKFIDIKVLTKSNAHAIINHLNSLFRYYGIFSEINCDNGPPYNSFEFKIFCNDHNIKLSKSPVYHPQSNGSAERGVQTVKKYFKKYLLDRQISGMSVASKIHKFLIDYNNTPNTVTGRSPNSLLLSYTPKTLLNAINDKFRKSCNDNINKKIHFDLKKNKTHRYYSKNKINLNNKKSNQENLCFKKGEKVLYRNHFKDILKWIPATVVKQLSKYLYVVNIKNNIKTVHMNQLKRSNLDDEWHPVVDINNDENNFNNNSKCSDNTNERESNHSQNTDVSVNSRPQRNRRPPDRFCCE